MAPIKGIIRLAPTIIVGLSVGIISGVVASIVITVKAAWDGKVDKSEQATAERAYGAAIWGAMKRLVPFLDVE